MEHRRLDGKIYQGYFCSTCGKGGMSMYGHHNVDCEPNPELVKQLTNMNRAALGSKPLIRITAVIGETDENGAG